MRARPGGIGYPVPMSSFVFVIVLLLILAGIIITTMSRRGSGITERPHPGDQGAPGAAEPTEFEGDPR